MPPLPTRFAATVPAFAPLFVQRSWRYAQVLLVGAILAQGQATAGEPGLSAGRTDGRRRWWAWISAVGALILLNEAKVRL